MRMSPKALWAKSVFVLAAISVFRGMMKRPTAIIIALSAILLGGCASTPQSPVTMNGDFWTAKDQRVAVVVPEVPKPSVALPGADCLLCIAAASAMNSSLIDHFESLSTEDLANIKNELATELNNHGVRTKIIDAFEDLEDLPKFKSDLANAAARDFSVFKSKFNATHVLVVKVTQVGAIRPYASYVPTSSPSATIQGAAYLVDVTTNTYDWYLPIAINRNSDGEWDEPPAFPGLTNAYYQVLAIAREQILAPFASKTANSPMVHNQ